MEKKTSTYSIFVRLVLLLALTAIMASMLTSCTVCDYIFKTSDDEKPQVTSVSISAEDGLSEEYDTYRAVLGEEFSLRATVNEDAPSNVAYIWSVAKTGEEPTVITGEIGDILIYRFEEYSAEGYTFFVKADNVSCSEALKIFTVYANISGVKIASESDTIIDNVLQRKIIQTSPIILNASWNSEYMDPAKTSSCAVEWRVGSNPTVISTDAQLSLEQPSTSGDLIIKLTVTDGVVSKSATVTINIVEKFNAVDCISLSLNSGAASDGKGQYVQTITSPERPFSAVTLSAAVSPLGTDNSAEVIWTLRNRNGINVLPNTSRELTFIPSYGENYITSTIDNVVSRQINIIALTDSEYESRKDKIDDVFIWEAGIFNHFISDQTDLNALVCYIISCHETATNSSDPSAHSMYVAKPEWKDGAGNSTAAFSEAIGTAMSCSDESGYFPFNYSSNVIYIVPSSGGKSTAFGNPCFNYPSVYTVNQYENVITHFSSSSEERTALPVDSFVDSLTVKTSDQLYRAVEWGYKPVFEGDAAGTKLQTLYNKARDVLCDIIDDDMSDFEKVRAINEWISQEVYYDYSAAESEAEIAEKVTYNAFYLEGVFEDKKAVCDGRSKAFVLLCGMEGITSLRITGEAITPQSSTPVGHAWNKVLLDIGDSGKKEWYFVDTTWSDRGMEQPLYNTKSEIMTMQYFLVTDTFTSSTHNAESVNNPVANTAVNYYSLATIENGDNDFDLYIDSDNELKNAVLYSKTHNVRLDLKVSSTVASSKAQLNNKIAIILSTNGGGSLSLIEFNNSEQYFNLYITA